MREDWWIIHIDLRALLTALLITVLAINLGLAIANIIILWPEVIG